MQKAKIRLTEEMLLELIGAPSGSRLAGVQAHVDPPSVEVIVEHSSFPVVPMGSESLMAQVKIEHPPARLAVEWPRELPF